MERHRPYVSHCFDFLFHDRRMYGCSWRKPRQNYRWGNLDAANCSNRDDVNHNCVLLQRHQLRGHWRNKRRASNSRIAGWKFLDGAGGIRSCFADWNFMLCSNNLRGRRAKGRRWSHVFEHQ